MKVETLAPLSRWLFLSLLTNYFLHLNWGNSLILSGSHDSYARYPKWAQTFENQLSFEFKTKMSDVLLFYTDDGAVQGNFYVVTIVDSHVQLDFRLGDEQESLINRPVINLRVDAVNASDGQWHKFVLFQAWENVKLQVDDSVVFKLLTQRSFIFGNMKTNSDVFIGGVPRDIHQLEVMSSPLRRHSKRFAGSLKNLIYRLYPQGVSSPQLINSIGTRLTDDDYCDEPDIPYCLNGRCYSTNDGPKCDCNSDFQGRQCEKKKSDAELSFYGSEWIGYDVSNSTSAAIANRREKISFMFKTKVQNGLLFVAGDRQNYVQLILERNVLIAISKLFGSDKRIIRQRYSQGARPVRYDDDQWHTVYLHRDLRVMRLTVDGNTDEVKQFASDTEWLGNSFAYVGGMASEKPYVPSYSYMFKGCMKKIKYEADVQSLDIIELADQGYGKSVIRTGGDLAFSCLIASNAPPDILSFSDSGQGFITLPKWNSLSSGSLGFQFRTSISDGLILYHGVRDIPLNGSADYIAFEINDGHLFMVIDLGSGYVRLQTTSRRINEGNVWHSVTLERVGRAGSVMVDTIKTDFSTPGVSANLIIEDPIYIGGAPWYPVDDISRWTQTESIRLPSTVWSATLRQGFVGCLKNVRINGMNAQIASTFLHHSDNSTARHTEGIYVGCTAFTSGRIAGGNFCKSAPCHNFGHCTNGHLTFQCDCSTTTFDGPTCELAPPVINFKAVAGNSAVFQLPEMLNSEAEVIEVKFRTVDENAVLLDTRAQNATDRILLMLLNSKLLLRLHFANNAKHIFSWSMSNLNDNHWHTVKISRRGLKLLLFLDGKWEHSHFLPEGELGLMVEELSPGRTLRPIENTISAALLAKEQEKFQFKVDLLKLTYNQYDILWPIRQIKRAHMVVAQTSTPHRSSIRGKSKTNTITLNSEHAFAQYSIQMDADKPFQLSLKFKTIASSSLLLALTTNSTTRVGKFEVVASLELIRGKIQYRFGQMTVITPDLTKKKRLLNDLKWHTISIQADPNRTASHQISIDNETIQLKTFMHYSLSKAQLLIGGFPRNFQQPNRASDVLTISGFRGCISSLKVAQKSIDLMEDAESSEDVHRGCQGPIPRCAPNLCQNGGTCHQGWRDVRCDCTKTSHSGQYCEKPGTTYYFDALGSSIYREFFAPDQPNTVDDFLVLSFQTQNSNGVLFSVQCAVDGDYLTVFLGGGYLQVRFNLGNQDHHLGYFNIFVNDDKSHLLRMRRHQTNMTLLLDQNLPVHYITQDQNQLFTLNSQRYAVIGASMNVLHGAIVYATTLNEREKRAVKEQMQVFDEFSGTIAGVNFNGLLILDMFANGDPSVRSTGNPQLSYMATRQPAFDPAEYPKNSVMASDSDSEHLVGSSGFFEGSPLGCLSSQQYTDCERVVPSEGFFTPVLPKALDSEQQATSERNRIRHSKTTKASVVWTALTSTTSSRKPLKLTAANRLYSTTPLTTQPVITRSVSPEFKRRTILRSTKTTTIKPTIVVEEINNYDDVENENEDEEDYADLQTPPPATYAPFARARLVDEGPNELDNLWTDLSEAVEFKSGASWRRPTTASVISSPPTSTTTSPRQVTASTVLKTVTTTLLATTSHLITSTTPTKTEHSRQVFLLSTTTQSASLLAVRPTTPFGPNLMMTVAKFPATTGDFPRTALILFASISVIVIIAIVVFCVFRCRQSGPPHDSAYPMAYSGKSSGITAMTGAGTLTSNHGYLPIPSEMSPPTQHTAQFATMGDRQACYDTMNGVSTLPAVLRRNSAPNGGPATNGYKPLTSGQMIVNANGETSPARANGHTNGMANGGSRTLGSSVRKKEFKEWYV